MEFVLNVFVSSYYVFFNDDVFLYVFFMWIISFVGKRKVIGELFIYVWQNEVGFFENIWFLIYLNDRLIGYVLMIFEKQVKEIVFLFLNLYVINIVLKFCFF